MNIHEELYQAYRFVNNQAVILIRILISLFLVALLFADSGNVVLKGSLFFLLLMLINELFIHFGINMTLPGLRLSEKGEDAEKILFETRVLLDDSGSIEKLIKKLTHVPEAAFLIRETGPFKILPTSLIREELLGKAKELAQSSGGIYISSIDLFTAYLLLSEEESKYLFNNDLTEKDLLKLLTWGRHTYRPDRPKTIRIQFVGSGYADFFIYGWNYETKKYAQDYTLAVMREAQSAHVVGRRDEYERLIGALSKITQNNVLLRGMPGTGKTSLVKHFAYNAYAGEITKKLEGKRVYQLFVDRILLGIDNQGQLEERLNLLLSDIIHAGNDIVFIQNIENLFGGGGFTFDASGVVYDNLKTGKLQIIGTTTPGAFKTYLENKKSITENFELINLEEPNQEEALLMLFEKVPLLERKYHIEFSYTSLTETIVLSSSYMLDSYLPGKAINLLATVAAELSNKNIHRVEKKDIIASVERSTQILIAEPGKEEKDILLHLENALHKHIVDQEEAVVAVANALRRLRSGFVSEKRPISVFLFLGPTGVGKTETAKTLSRIYFHSEGAMIRLDMSEYQTQDSTKRLLGSLPGEENASSTFIDQVREKPFSLILLEEFEKAHETVLNVFLQVFEDGRLTDNRGSRVSFVNTIIIATSNAGSEFVRESIENKVEVAAIKDQLFEKLQKDNIFKPELLNRFDDVVVFKPLSERDIQKITILMLQESLKLLEDQRIMVDFDSKAVAKIATEAFSREYGARNIRRYIEKEVEGLISRLILEEKVRKGEKKELSVDEKGEFILA